MFHFYILRFLCDLLEFLGVCALPVFQCGSAVLILVQLFLPPSENVVLLIACVDTWQKMQTTGSLVRWLSYGELRALVQAEELGLNFSREVRGLMGKSCWESSSGELFVTIFKYVFVRISFSGHLSKSDYDDTLDLRTSYSYRYQFGLLNETINNSLNQMF